MKAIVCMLFFIIAAAGPWMVSSTYKGLPEVDHGEVEDYYHAVVLDQKPSPPFRRRGSTSNLRRSLKPKDQGKDDKTTKAAAPAKTQQTQQKQSSLTFPLCRADEMLVVWDVQVDDATYYIDVFDVFDDLSRGEFDAEYKLSLTFRRAEYSIGHSCLPMDRCYTLVFVNKNEWEGFDFQAYPDAHVLFQVGGSVIMKYDKDNDIWPTTGDIDTIAGLTEFGTSCQYSGPDLCTQSGGTCLDAAAATITQCPDVPLWDEDKAYCPGYPSNLVTCCRSY
jgi:hypothetical protein